MPRPQRSSCSSWWSRASSVQRCSRRLQHGVATNSHSYLRLWRWRCWVASALAALPGEWTGYVVAAALGLLLLSVLLIVLEMVEERAGAAVSTATSAVWLAGNGGGVIVSGVIGLFLGTPAFAFVLMAIVPFALGLPLWLALRRRVAMEAAANAATGSS